MPRTEHVMGAFGRDPVKHLRAGSAPIAEVDGMPAGPSIGLPDLDEWLADAKRVPRWLGLLRWGGRHYDSGELSWTQGIDAEVNTVAAQLGLTPSRRYRIYETRRGAGR
jgi:hypothetical protein